MSTRSPFNPDPLHPATACAQTAPRLYLNPKGFDPCTLGGAWWPRSRNPASELPGLIMAIDATCGQVLRLVLAATGWDERPRRVIVGERTITIDYDGSQAAALLTAACVRSRLDLTVIPPTAGPRTARSAMVQARTAGNRFIAPDPPMSPGTSHAIEQAVPTDRHGCVT